MTKIIAGISSGSRIEHCEECGVELPELWGEDSVP